MHKTVRWVLVLSLFVGIAAPCVGDVDGAQWLVSPELVKAGGLKIVWQSVFPVQEGEKLASLDLVGTRIYGLSSRNYMVSMDTKDGVVVFTKMIAPAGFPLLGFDLFDDQLISVIGNRVIEINPGTGTVVRSKRIEYGLVCPVARNKSHYYLPGVDHRVHVVKAENFVQMFEAGGKNNAAITSVAAGEDYVVFSTDGGMLTSFAADKPIQYWEMRMAEGIIGPMIRQGDTLFFACKDTNLYRIDVTNKQTNTLTWKYQLDSVPDRSPRVTKDVVYQYGRDKGVTAVDKKTGKFMWNEPTGLDLLAESDGKAYLIGVNKTLVVMDNAKRKKLYSLNLAGVSLHATNTGDSRIYIGGSKGRVMCLEPVKKGR